MTSMAKIILIFVLGMGPAIFGHSNPEIIAAVNAQLDRQFSAASAVMHTTLEIELAEKVVQYVPCADKVRFGISGTEADQLAMRVARGFTGRRLCCPMRRALSRMA